VVRRSIDYSIWQNNDAGNPSLIAFAQNIKWEAANQGATSPCLFPIAIITGGSRGLGRATVEALAARGVWSIFTYQSNHAAAEDVTAAVALTGARAVALQLDSADTAKFPAFVDAVRHVLADWGATHVDYLVNNAGGAHYAPIEAVSEDDFDALYRVHVKGVFFLSQRLLPLLADGGGSSTSPRVLPASAFRAAPPMPR
jgi:NAD(P)-dependent dehydrogenase (short-subunit alcohol dehydrogenase family)